MDLQSRKIHFVQEFLKIQNEEIISRLEKILKKGKENTLDGDFKPMPIDEYNKRIDESLEDSKNDRVIEVNDLISEIQKWN